MAGGSQGEPDDIITGINVTPLVDIILVLLIVFMLTAKLIAASSIRVDLPEASTGEAAEPTTLALTLTHSGELYLNGSPTDEASLKAYIPSVVKSDPTVQAVIAADAAVTHGEVVHLIDLVRQLGVYKFAINIDPVGPEVSTAP